MSTEERDKAAREYAETLTDVPANSETLRRYVARLDFKSGWDARGQVTPDRPTINEIASVIDDHVDMPLSSRLVVAAAILALFNEKGNE